MAKVLIFGAGAVGQFIGGIMTRAGQHDITLLGRSDHYNAIRQGGLNLQRPSGKINVVKTNFYPMIEKLSHRETFDWIFLTVKAYDIKNAIKELRGVFETNKNIKILLFQRGVGSHEQLEGIIPEERLFMAAQTYNVAIIEPGTVVETNQGGAVCIAPIKFRNDTGELKNIFSGSGIKVETFEDWKPMKWSALLYEMLTNGFCALSDYIPEKLLEYEYLFKMEMDSFKEGVNVVNKLGVDIVDLPAYAVKKMIFLNNLPGFIKAPLIKKELTTPKNTRVPTIKSDMEKAKKSSEVEYINGAISRWGKERGVNTPINGFLTEELQKIVSGKTKWEVYRRKPEKVIDCYRIYYLNYRHRT